MKRIVALIFALFILFPIGNASAAKWQLMYENDAVQVFFDADSVTYQIEEQTEEKDKDKDKKKDKKDKKDKKEKKEKKEKKKTKLIPNRDIVTLWTKWDFKTAERRRLAKSENEADRADIAEMVELHIINMKSRTILRSMTVTYDELGQPNHDGLSISGGNVTKAEPGTLGAVELEKVAEFCKKQDKKIVKHSIEEEKKHAEELKEEKK